MEFVFEENFKIEAGKYRNLKLEKLKKLALIIFEREWRQLGGNFIDELKIWKGKVPFITFDNGKIIVIWIKMP